MRDSVASTWLSKFQRNYKAYYGRELDVPRWKDIKDRYDLKSQREKEKLEADKERAETRQGIMSQRYRDAVTLLDKARLDGRRQNIEKAEAAVLRARENLAKAEEQLQKAVEAYGKK